MVVADDNSSVLQELCALLAREFEVIATAKDGPQLIFAAQTLKPDVIITDISMPEMNGIEASRRILELAYCSRILILSSMNDPQVMKSALKAGVLGYVLKDNAGEELIDAVRSAVDGKVFLSADVRQPEPEN